MFDIKTKGLNEKEYKLLGDIVFCKKKASNKLFDKRDNCFQVSNRVIASTLKIPASRVDQLVRKLVSKGLAKRGVFDVYQEARVMINPAFLYEHDDVTFKFTYGMFALGSHDKAVDWFKLCVDLKLLVSPDTGEVMQKYDWYEVVREAMSYQTSDRHYVPKELPIDYQPLTLYEYDKKWYDMFSEQQNA